jgi:hypothetical protein
MPQKSLTTWVETLDKAGLLSLLAQERFAMKRYCR